MFIPGKILVIENNWDDVKEVIESFWKAGEGIVYSRGIPDKNKCPANVRLVILDLVLGGGGEIQDTDYDQAALALIRIEKKTGFFLVAPWSVHITSQNRTEVIRSLQEAYKNQTGKDLPRRILRAFGKGEVHQRQLVKEIERWIRENPEAGLVFEWEKDIQNGMDKTASQLFNEGGIRTTVKALEKEYGTVAAPRATFTLFSKLLLRHSLVSWDESRFRTLVKNVLRGKDTGETDVLAWYPGIRDLEAYHQVDKKEPLWTGDILETNLQDRQRQYAIVITPACDFAQKKVTKIKVAYGTEVETIEDYQADDRDVPLVVQKLGRTKKAKWKKRKEVIDAIVRGYGLPDRFYILHFLKPSANADRYFHLFIDFSDVASKASKESKGDIKVPDGWQRICRLDSPYLEDLLQKYASFCARVGTPDIPEDVVKKEKERLIS